MGYLRSQDYLARIQQVDLNGLTTKNAALLSINEGITQEFVSSYLRQKYDVVNYFAPTTIWSPTTTYSANQLIELNYPAFVAGVYQVNGLVSFTDGNAYLCNAITTNADIPGISGKWTLIGANQSLYYYSYPYSIFDINTGGYKPFDRVWFKGSVYQNIVGTKLIDHEEAIQNENTWDIPYANVFPDELYRGVLNWGAGTPYIVPAGIIPNAPVSSYAAWSNVTTYAANSLVGYNGVLYYSLVAGNINNTPGADIINWLPVYVTLGDNRDQNITRIYVDIVLYNISARIAPQNVEELTVKRYDDACKWLQQAAKGVITCSLPRLQPYRGEALRIGSNVKQENKW